VSVRPRNLETLYVLVRSGQAVFMPIMRLRGTLHDTIQIEIHATDGAVRTMYRRNNVTNNNS
jgi:hypothetical protein